MKKHPVILLLAAALLLGCSACGQIKPVTITEESVDMTEQTTESTMTADSSTTVADSMAADDSTTVADSTAADDSTTVTDSAAADGSATVESSTIAPTDTGKTAGNTILIDKTARTLTLSDADGTVLYTCAVGLSQNPTGAKLQEGDKKTPEGAYYVCVKNAKSKFHKALGLSYPNREDADRGFAAGLITEAEKDAIDQAVDNGAQPSWSTALGGQCMIHGQKGDLGSQSNWTTGCIAVNNEDIDAIWPLTQVGTKVTIKP